MFGSSDISSVLGPLTPYQKPVVKNVGVFFGYYCFILLAENSY